MNLALTTRSRGAKRSFFGALLAPLILGPLVIGAVLAAPAAAQQDTVTLKDGKSETGTIKSEDFAGVAFKPAKGAERTIAWPELQPNGIAYGGSPEFASAKESYDAGRLDEALPKAQELAADAKLRAPLRQNAMHYVATIQQRKGAWDEAIAAYKALYEAFPKSRYLIEVGEGLVGSHIAKSKDYAGATKALDELSNAASSAGVESGFNAAINVLKGRIFEDQGKHSEALGAYGVAEKATGAPAVVVQQARLGQGRCLVATKKPTEGEALFRKVTMEEAPNTVLAGAWNGIGELMKQQGFEKRDTTILKDALFAHLRGVVQYGPVPGESTTEYERALRGSADCFKFLAGLEKGDKAKYYTDHANLRMNQLQKEFPNSPFLK